MNTRIKQCLLIAVLGVISSFAMVVPAQAEQCSPDGKICLVTDTSQPVVLPSQLEFRVASEANFFDIEDSTAQDVGYGSSRPFLIVRSVTLVEQGPLGGTSRWVVDLAPTVGDYTYTVKAKAAGPTTLDEVGEFGFLLPTLAPASNLETRMYRKGKWFVAEAGFEARKPVVTGVLLGLCVTQDLTECLVTKKRVRTLSPSPGRQVSRVLFPRKRARKLCREESFCKVGVVVTQYVSGADPATGRQLFDFITHVDASGPGAALVIKDDARFCRKLRKQKLVRKYPNAYRKRCIRTKRGKRNNNKHSMTKRRSRS